MESKPVVDINSEEFEARVRQIVNEEVRKIFAEVEKLAIGYLTEHVASPIVAQVIYQSIVDGLVDGFAL